MTLRSRGTAIVTTLVVCGIGIASVLAYTSTRRELVQETDRFLVDRADELVDGQRQGPDNSRGRRDDGPGLAFDPDSIAQTLDRNGRISATSGGGLPIDASDIAIADGTSRATIRDVTIDDVPFRMITSPMRDGGAVQVARETSGTADVLSGLRWRLGLAGVVLGLFAALLGWLLMRRTTKPLEELTAAATRVATTADLTPLNLDRTDEVGTLANSFDRMLAALALSREQQHRLVQDAGHELRTPLTSLRANIELLHRAKTLPPEEHEQLLAGLTAEVAELTNLFNELIHLATDSGAQSESNVEFDMAEVVADAVDRFRRRTGRTVHVDAAPTPTVGNPSRIDRAVTNLLGNAHKFSPGHESIDVRLLDRRLIVSDHGPGIPVDDQARVFERFYRSDAARAQPGSGLGLAIVRQIAEQHGGAAFASTTAAGGAAVGFTIAD